MINNTEMPVTEKLVKIAEIAAELSSKAVEINTLILKVLNERNDERKTLIN